VADFVGNGAWLPGRVAAVDAVTTDLGTLRGSLTAELPAGAEVDLLLRPDDVVYDEASPLRARVAGKQFKGSTFLYELDVNGGTRLLAIVSSHHDHPVGSLIGIRVEPKHMVVFPRVSA